MTKLKLHFDGWLALPATARRRLGVTTGDQLEAEWTDGGLLIKNPKVGLASTQADLEDDAIATIVAEKPAPKPKKVAPVRSNASNKLAASTIPRARGRRKAAAG